MKERNFFRDRLFPVIFMFLLTVVFIGGISALYLSTKDIVLLNETIALKKSVLYVANIDIPDTNEKINEVFSARVNEVKTSSAHYFEIKDPAGKTVSYVIYSYGPGLWGQITALIGLKPDLKTITGVDFISQNETPGLGARITEKWFTEQFRGKQAPFTQMTSENDGKAPGPGAFDAITGATRTSTGVKYIMNHGVQEAATILGKEQ